VSVTSDDVARVAGVSQATVSRVLHGSPRVTAATREKVLRAVATTGYQPNLLARAMRTRRTGTVGVVVARITNPFYPEALDALGACLAAAGQRMVLWDSDRAGEDAALEAVRQGMVDGVLFTTATAESQTLAEALARNAPVVLFNRGIPGAGCDQVTSDNERGAAAAARHLVHLGHTRIGLIGGPPLASTARDRASGFRRALAELGAPLGERLCRDGDFSHDGARQAIRELLALPRPPTAVFCVNDLSAFGAVDGARELGVDVPGGLSVIGYDDVAMAAWQSYRLTTVSQSLPRMAARAVEFLLDRIAAPELPVRVERLAGELVCRATTGLAS
jgi:LacI family transcriptional regulator